MSISPLQTEEELLFVKEFIILPVMIDVLEKDIHTMNTVGLKMPRIYISSLRMIQKTVLTRQHLLKNELRSRGIKIFEQQRTKASLQAQYQCRGYQHRMELLWDIVKAEIEVKLAAHLPIDPEEDDC
jgi:hypothetical protein